jgi:hypothetical protein
MNVDYDHYKTLREYINNYCDTYQSVSCELILSFEPASETVDYDDFEDTQVKKIMLNTDDKYTVLKQLNDKNDPTFWRYLVYADDDTICKFCKHEKLNSNIMHNITMILTVHDYLNDRPNAFMAILNTINKISASLIGIINDLTIQHRFTLLLESLIFFSKKFLKNKPVEKVIFNGYAQITIHEIICKALNALANNNIRTKQYSSVLTPLFMTYYDPELKRETITHLLNEKDANKVSAFYLLKSLSPSES